MQHIVEGIGYLRNFLGNSQKVLLVCGRSLSSLSIYEEIQKLPVTLVRFSQFAPNPSYEEVCKGVEIFNTEQCDTILAVGGGSAIDVAKCIKLYCKMSKDKPYLEQEYEDTGIKLIAIPTTAGTGSESTRYAVIYYDGKKQSVTHDSIIPDVAILEPKVLKTLPLYQKKCTMLDALCQGIESWWSVNSTDESKKYSKNAVETIMKWWREYIFENTDESAEYMMQASNLAGQAINITQTTAPHAFSYKLTSMYGLPHGHAVAVCLPVIWEYMFHNMDQCIDQRGEKYLESIFESISNSMDFSTPIEAIIYFRTMMDEMEMANPVSANKAEDIELLSQSVNPVRLKNNPVRLEIDAIVSVYTQILK